MTNRPEFKVVEGGAGSMDKMKALEAALSQIEKMHGKGSVMRLGASDQSMDVEAISTGSLGLDIALDIGGLPRGRVIEIYGPESSGKTTLSLQVVAEAQKSGGILKRANDENPPSASIHEEGSNIVTTPFVPVFNNLIDFDQSKPLFNV